MKTPIYKLMILLYFTSQFFTSGTDQFSKLIKLVDEYLKQPTEDLKKLRFIMESGKIDGLFGTDEVLEIFKHLSKNYSQFVKTEIIGKTFENRPLEAYFLSNDGFINEQLKSIVLFTGVHHARELLSTSMVIKIFMESLYSLIHKTDNEVWKYNDIIIIPIVNFDSHKFITDSWGTKNWDSHKWKRKNMNNNFCNNNVVDQGVDLNRNYGYHYAETLEDTEQCGETFRGNIAFSEPETQAVRDLIEKYPKIVSAMNFHTYGNMWIHPYNYLNKGKVYPINTLQKFIDFYENFGKEIQKVSPGSLYGNAIEMVDYSTDGEGSDWMFGEKNIIAFSPELGSVNQNAQTFYPQKDLIFDLIQENYKIIKLFLTKNVFQLKNLTYSNDNQQNFVIQFQNVGLSDLHNAVFKFQTNNLIFLQNINQISFQNQYSDLQNVQIIDFSHQDFITFKILQVNRMESFTIKLHFTESIAMRNDFEINMSIFLYNGSQITEQNIKVKIPSKNNLYFVLFLFVSCISVMLFFGIHFIKTKNKRIANQQKYINQLQTIHKEEIKKKINKKNI